MQSRSLLFLLGVIVAAALSGVALYFLKPSYGLDVQGGSRFVFRMKTEELKTDTKIDVSSMQNDLVSIMGNRASGALSVSEPQVTAKGTDQIVVELPGFTNVNEARSVLSNTARIVVYWASNVQTTQNKLRRFIPDGREAGDDGVEYEVFSKTVDPSKVLKPGDPEYAAMIKDWFVILEGSDVRDARPIVNGSKTQPEFFFNDKGAKKLDTWSRQQKDKEESIAFVLDNRVLSIAPVKKGTILSDNAFIDGDFPAAYVKQLTELIKAGSLPVPLEELSRETVDPTIGREALGQMVTAGLISIGAICLFAIVYYAFPGIIAALAMALYGLFTLALLLSIRATLSLASVAAFILSVGMAIDANILVFERIKEELRAGKTVAQAIPIAFRRALSAIVDSNACTVITCLVLLVFGTGAVKGFATTLILGVAVSFLTAFLVTRTLLEVATRLGLGTDPKMYAIHRNWFGGGKEEDASTKALPIIGRAKLWFLLSGLFILPGLIAVAMGGIKANVEFLGGSEGTYMVPPTVTNQQIREKLEDKGYRGFNLKFANTSAGKVVYITVPKGSDLTNEKLAADAGLPLERSGFTNIGPSIQKETVTNAILGITIASVLIMLYLAVRFGVAVGGVANGIKFGMSAVAALVHDVLFVVGTAGIVGLTLGWEISALFITAMLTVIGFSVHDTIIIFDRIRENLRRPNKGMTFEQICDISVTQSVSRSVNTSLSAVVPLGVLLFFGTPTPELKFMTLTMLLGIGIGAYSSIFNATPILYFWDRMVRKSKGEAAGLLAQAQQETRTRAMQVAAAGATPAAGADPRASGYGQVKRRSGVVEKASTELDD